MIEREITEANSRAPEQLASSETFKIVLDSEIRLRKVFGSELDSSNFQLTGSHLADIQFDIQVHHQIAYSIKDIRAHLSVIYQFFSSLIPTVTQYCENYRQTIGKKPITQYSYEACQRDFVFSIIRKYFASDNQIFSDNTESALCIFLEKRLLLIKPALNETLEFGKFVSKAKLQKKNPERYVLQEWYAEAHKISLSHFFQLISFLSIEEQKLVLDYFRYTVNRSEYSEEEFSQALQKIINNVELLYEIRINFSVVNAISLIEQAQNFIPTQSVRYTRYEKPLSNKQYKNAELHALKIAQLELRNLERKFKPHELKSIILSFSRIQHLYGIDSLEMNFDTNSSFFNNVQYDHLIFFSVIQTTNQLTQVIEGILKIAEGYYPLALALTKKYLEKNGHEDLIDMEEFVNEFVIEQIQNFFLISNDNNTFQIQKLNIYIKQTFNKKLKERLQKHLASKQGSRSSVSKKDSDEKNLDKKIERWQAIAKTIDLAQIFYLISTLSIREQLVILLKFQYLRSVKYREFFTKYKISLSFYYGRLHQALDQVIQGAENSNIPRLDPLIARHLIDHMSSIKESQLLRHSDGSVINEGSIPFQLAELIIERGTKLLDSTLSRVQRTILTFVIDYYNQYNAFPTMNEVAAQFGNQDNEIKAIYERIIKSATHTAGIYIKKTNGTDYQFFPAGSTLYNVLTALRKGQLDRTLFSPAENYVLDFYRNYQDEVYPSSLEVAEQLGLSFETVRYYLNIAKQKLKKINLESE